MAIPSSMLQPSRDTGPLKDALRVKAEECELEVSVTISDGYMSHYTLMEEQIVSFKLADRATEETLAPLKARRLAFFNYLAQLLEEACAEAGGKVRVSSIDAKVNQHQRSIFIPQRPLTGMDLFEEFNRRQDLKAQPQLVNTVSVAIISAERASLMRPNIPVPIGAKKTSDFL